MSLSMGYMKIGFTACTIKGARSAITVAVQRFAGEILWFTRFCSLGLNASVPHSDFRF
jgi:hypothetical protein